MDKVWVGIVMGSDSDWSIMEAASSILVTFGVRHEIDIVSAHRTPEKLHHYACHAHLRGLRVLIAGAGGAAHLPGMLAAATPLPVIGVPIKSSNSLDGWDSLLSIVQMPNGVPVATVAVNGAYNAGILATQILSIGEPTLIETILKYKTSLKDTVAEKAEKLHFPMVR
ncbi:MAG: 5-(carboxyamino)imidazole ribonucleotide mutase [Bacteroidia bacterium]|nr:5-(carboxyamino)imidazole ribonucleotide mutase [Bacteroidia bacterium]